MAANARTNSPMSYSREPNIDRMVDVGWTQQSISAPSGPQRGMAYVGGPVRRDISPLPLGSSGNLCFDQVPVLSRPCSFAAPVGMRNPGLSVSIVAPPGGGDPRSRMPGSPVRHQQESYKPPLSMDGHMSEAMDMLAARVVGAVRSELQGAVRSEMQSSFSTTFRCAELMERSLIALRELVSNLETSSLSSEIRASTHKIIDEIHGHHGAHANQDTQLHTTYFDPNLPHCAPEAHAPTHIADKEMTETIRWNGALCGWTAIHPTRLTFVKRRFNERKSLNGGKASTQLEVEEPNGAFDDESYWTHFLTEAAHKHNYTHQHRSQCLCLRMVMPGSQAGLDLEMDPKHARWAQELKAHRMSLVRGGLIKRGVPMDKVSVTYEDGPEPMVFFELTDDLPVPGSRRSGSLDRFTGSLSLIGDDRPVQSRGSGDEKAKSPGSRGGRGRNRSKESKEKAPKKAEPVLSAWRSSISVPNVAVL